MARVESTSPKRPHPLVQGERYRQIHPPRASGIQGYQRGSEMKESGLHYQNAGVDDEAESAGLQALAERVRRTFELAGEAGAPGSVLLDLGYFANVVQVAPGLGIAVSTDGVGTKLLVAEML